MNIRTQPITPATTAVEIDELELATDVLLHGATAHFDIEAEYGLNSDVGGVDGYDSTAHFLYIQIGGLKLGSTELCEMMGLKRFLEWEAAECARLVEA